MRASAAYKGAYARILEGYELTAEQIENDHVFLVTNHGTLLGFYSLSGVRSEPELDLLFVSDASQGRGIGAALFEHMRSSARELGLGAVKIVSHPPAVRFYTRMGAQIVGRQAASERVTWERPILSLAIEGLPNASAPGVLPAEPDSSVGGQRGEHHEYG